MNLSALPDLRASQDPNGPSIADDDLDLTNIQFLESVQRAAATLRTHGIGAGDVVAVMLPNTAGLVVTLFAAWRIGAAVTPLSPALVPAEIAYQVADAGAKVLVTDSQVEWETPALLPVRELTAERPAAADPVEQSEHALALLIYTSGTTGRPKGVMLDHANLNAMCRMVIDAFELTSADHSLLILPLFHVNGIVVSTLSPLLAGGRTTIAGRFSPKTFFERIEQSGATYFSAVPTMYTMLADLPTDVTPNTSAVRFGVCGAAPASVELLEKFESRYDIPIVEGYGLSEGSCASAVNPIGGKRKPGTVGLPLPGQTIRIVDWNDLPVPDGEPGEVLVHGPNVMRGYLNRPDETAAALAGGWLHTGDIGRIDQDGYLVLLDRAKDMIIRGGENIYPKEIETVVYQLAEIAEAAVVGRADPVYGEQPVLFVSLNSGATIDAERIHEHARRSLSKFKLPVTITILDELPKNAVGKIDKPSLRTSLSPPRARADASSPAPKIRSSS
ncbi:class I adenylate-forming enzyme family protein [Nocardia sp. NPDC057440]|uniref:class I adenylate-forming enzyme family protein n=1 Tax=Nocardia sp. NPDC057440 TaxID=3346134 RepID=UPI00366AB793